MSEPRISAEAALLKAVSDDDAESVRGLLVADVPAAKLLCLRVKPTFNNARDQFAFFHSVASFGLIYALGDSIVDLAERNGCVQVAQVLREAAGAEVVVSAESRISAEARLLSAIAADDDQALGALLSGSVPASHILRLVVKEQFNDPSDSSSFFNSVASFGLKFELGDTAEQLAHRNGRMKAAAALEHHSMPSPAPGDPRACTSNLHVVVRNAVSGDLLAEIAASTSWTIGSLQKAMEKPTSGCWQFISEDSPLTTGICLADLCQDDGGILHLSVVILQVMTGAYHATIRSVGYRARNHCSQISLHLQDNDVSVLEFETTEDGPLPCANRPPALIHVKYTFKGTWSAEQPGVVAICRNGLRIARHRQRRGDEGSRIELDAELKMIMVQEGYLEIIERTFTGINSRFLPASFCSVGTVLVKSKD